MKFLINNYYVVLYGIALIISLVRYRKYFESLLKYFPILIGYTFLTEILGNLIREIDDLQLVYLEGYSYYNQVIYNIFEIVFFLYFYFVFWNSISKTQFKNFIKYGAILFIISSTINPFFQDFLLHPQFIASTVGSGILIYSIILYLIDKKPITNIPNHTNLLFWISLGLLVFYTFYPIILLIGYYNYGLYQKLHFRTIHHVLIVVMYSCFILGFLFMRPIRPKEDF